MERSTEHILTTHAGNLRWSNAEPVDLEVNAERVRQDVGDVVRRQKAVGIDVVSDGELGRPSSVEYFSKRLSGVLMRDLKPGETASTSGRTNDRLDFPNFYTEFYPPQGPGRKSVCAGPIAYIAQRAIQQEIEIFQAALEGTEVAEAFMCVQSPG